jgi:hypothetical protein
MRSSTASITSLGETCLERIAFARVTASMRQIS